MPIKDAVRLIVDTAESVQLRATLNTCVNPAELISFLSKKGYNFNCNEFNNAVRMLKLQCTFEEEAAFLMGKVMWLRYILNFKDE